MNKIAIFASGSGTNAENIVRYFTNNELIKVALVLSNHAKAGVHARVNALGVPSFTFSKEEFASATPILTKLAEFSVNFIVLAGFMSKIPDALLAAFPDRIVNIHPALLPKFGGKGMMVTMCMRRSLPPEKQSQASRSIRSMPTMMRERFSSKRLVLCGPMIRLIHSPSESINWSTPIIPA